MNDTKEATVNSKAANCPCCGEQMERKEGRLCQVCEREGCDPSTNLCHRDLITDGGPEDPTDADLIGAAADHYDVDLDRAVTAVDPDPDSSRIYILEDVADGYRLMEYGLAPGYPEEGQPAAEEPIHIPVSAVGELQGLLHAAGLQQAENELAREDGQDGLNLRDVAEGMGVAAPLDGDR